MVKDIEQIVYKMILLSTKVYTLRAANEVLSKHYRAKKARICEEGVFIVEDIQDFLSQKDIEEQAQRDLHIEGARKKEG